MNADCIHFADSRSFRLSLCRFILPIAGVPSDDHCLHDTNNVAFGLLCAIVRSRCYLLGLDGVWIENLHFRFTWKCRRLTPRRRLPAFSVLRLSSHADDSGIALSIRYHTLCLHEHGLGSLNKQHTLNALIAKWTNGTESAWTSDRPKCEAKINK